MGTSSSRHLESPSLGKIKRTREESNLPSSKKLKTGKYDYISKSLLLFITTHGEIPSSTDEPEVFTIPTGVRNILKLNLAPPDSYSIMSALDIDDVREALKTHNTEKALKEIEELSGLHQIYEKLEVKLSEFGFLTGTDDIQKFIDFMKKLQDDIIPFYDSYVNKWPESVREIRALHEAVNLHMWLEEPLRQESNGRNQFVHISEHDKRQMVNKMFTTGSREEHSASHLNFGILAFNPTNSAFVDIFGDIRAFKKLPIRSTQEGLMLTTQDIFDFIDHFRDYHGRRIVENVLILDTSCAIFDSEIPEDKLSNLKELSESYGYGGKRRRQKRKSQKKNPKKGRKSQKKNPKKSQTK